jgi:hypothetical protein
VWRRQREPEPGIDPELVDILLNTLHEIRTNTRILVRELTDEEEDGSGEEEED